MNLVVFFSRGMSLEAWQHAGILGRELALYRVLRSHTEQMSLLTYGGARDRDLARTVPDLGMLVNVAERSANRYSLTAPWIHRQALRRATIFRTNQLNGAWTAVVAKYWFRKKLVVRCGFLWSESALKSTRGRVSRACIPRVERWMVRAADRVIVATGAHREVMVRRYGVDAARVHVIPNYVDTSLFRPLPDIPRERGRVTFVGRLAEEKNLLALVEALRGVAGVTLTFIGDGPLRAQLEAAAADQHVPAEFLGIRPHADLPALLNRSTVFVLPSLYEGHPKALIEAMACGVPAIGTSVAGIREVLTHRETGYLCGTAPGEIRAAVQTVLSDQALRDRMGAAGMAYARDHCSLESAADRELSVLRSLEVEAGARPGSATPRH